MADRKPGIVYQRSKNGEIYVYENYPYWSKENQRSQAKRICIGKLDPVSNQIIPTRGRKPNPSVCCNNINDKAIARCRSYGATYLLDEIGKKLNIIEDLKSVFSDTYKQILSIAYYMILEDNSPLSRFEKWSNKHKHPYDRNIPSQRSSELFASITDSDRAKFFKLQKKRRIDKEYLFQDITSISSYSEALRLLQYGYNRENDKLPQLNLAIVYGESSELPFYYRKLAGNIPDMKTLKPLLSDFTDLGFDNIKVGMDRAFYTEENINALYKDGVKFLIGANKDTKYIKDQIDSARAEINQFKNYNDDYALYGHTVQTKWSYKEKRPNKGDILKEKKRIYVHVYYNSVRAVEEEQKFNKRLATLRKELLDNKKEEKNKKKYDEYFISTTDSNGKIQAVEPKQEAINAAKRNYGYFAIVSNDISDTWTALSMYRRRDVAEKAFHNLKDCLDVRRLRVASEESLDGKLFVAFIALNFLAYINKQMRVNKLYKDYTLQEMFDKLGLIDCYENQGKKLRTAEVLNNQKQLYTLMDIKSL